MEEMHTKKQEAAFLAQSIKIASVVAFYWFVSITMVFLNKFLLSDVDMNAPVFITWFQCIVAVIWCFTGGLLRNSHPAISSFPEFKYDLAIAKQVLPLSLMFVGMITFNNLCLQYVGVAFYNVGRSLTTVFNVILSYIILGESTSFKAIITCFIIISGFLMGVDQEGRSDAFSWLGVIYGVLASACVALNSIYTKRVLPVVEGDAWRLMGYNNMNAVLLFIPMMLILGESKEVFASADIMTTNFWLMMTLAGLFGVAIGLATTWQIDITSPLTHNISGTAKACAQTILALWWKEESKSVIWWLSNVLVLGGSSAYTIVRRNEMKEKIAQTQILPK